MAYLRTQGLNEAVRAPPSFGKSVETSDEKLLQNSEKPEEIVANIELKASIAN